jgi:hypothetical protein
MTTVFILRWIVWGYIISKHGENKKVEKYNAWSHLLFTLYLGWMLYEFHQILNK